MIQLNLLPDVKLEYIKAQKQHRLIMTLSVLAIIVTIGLTVLLLVVSTLEKARLSALTEDIQDKVTELKDKPDIDKILTVQNQLNSLTALHTAKPAINNVYGLLVEVTPQKVTVSEFTATYSEKKIKISGNADSLSSVNKFVDTLKFTKFTSDKIKDKAFAFNSVVMTEYGVNPETKDPNQFAEYTIEMGYDDAIFDITQRVRLDVPNLITTRSEMDRPTSDLFKASPNSEEEKE
jgi:hypothetical protein